MKKNRTRYFMTADFDLFRVEYVTKKEMLSLMKDANNSNWKDCNNKEHSGFEDNYFDAVAVETKDYFRASEEETVKEATHIIRAIERSRNVNIVNENSECYIVCGAIEINENGVVLPSEHITDSIDISITEISEAEAEEIEETERRNAEARRTEAEARRNNIVRDVLLIMNSRSYETEEEAEADAVNMIITMYGKGHYTGIMLAEVMQKYRASAEEAVEAEEAEQAEEAVESPILASYYAEQKALAEAIASTVIAEAEARTAEEQTEETIEASEASESEKVMKKQNNSNIASVAIYGITEENTTGTEVVAYYKSDRSRSFNSIEEATASVKSFIASAEAVAVGIDYKHTFSPYAVYSFYASEAEAEQAEEAEEEAKERAKADARFYNAKHHFDDNNKYVWHDFYHGKDVTYYITAKAEASASEEANKKFTEFCKKHEENKKFRQEQEQKKAEQAKAKAEAEEIAEAIEASESFEVLTAIAEQAKEAERKYNCSEYYVNTSIFNQLSEQAKAKAKTTASAEQLAEVEIAERIEEAETMRYYAEASASAEEIAVLETEIEMLKNRQQKLKEERRTAEEAEVEADAEEQEQETTEATEASIDLQIFATEEAIETLERLKCVYKNSDFDSDSFRTAEQEQQKLKKLLKLNMQYFAKASEADAEQEQKQLYIVEIEYRNRKTNKFKYGIATKAEASAIANSDIDNIYVTVLNRYTEAEEQETATASAETTEATASEAIASEAVQETATASIITMFQLFLFWILTATAEAEQKQKKQKKLLKLNMQYFATNSNNKTVQWLKERAENVIEMITAEIEALSDAIEEATEIEALTAIAEQAETRKKICSDLKQKQLYIKCCNISEQAKAKAEAIAEAIEQKKAEVNAFKTISTAFEESTILLMILDTFVSRQIITDSEKYFIFENYNLYIHTETKITDLSEEVKKACFYIDSIITAYKNNIVSFHFMLSEVERMINTYI